MKTLIFFLVVAVSAFGQSRLDIEQKSGPEPQFRQVVGLIHDYLIQTGEYKSTLENVTIQGRVCDGGFYGWRVTFGLKGERPSRSIIVRRDLDAVRVKYILAK